MYPCEATKLINGTLLVLTSSILILPSQLSSYFSSTYSLNFSSSSGDGVFKRKKVQRRLLNFYFPRAMRLYTVVCPNFKAWQRNIIFFPAPFVSCVITFQLNRLFMANYPQNLDVHCAPKIYLLIRHLRCFEAYFINNFNILTI